MAGKRNDPLNASADEALHDLARLAFHSFQRRLEQEMVAYGVSPAQWRFLRQLWHSNGICQRRLAGRLATSEANATITLRELEKKGLIDRRRNASNRREVLIFLTPRGRGLESALMPVTRDIHIRATHGIAMTEVTALERLLRRVIANLDRR